LNKQTILIVSLNKYVANPLDYGGNDQRIIEVAKVLSDTAKSEDEVILMSIDFYMRIRAQAIGLNTLDFKIINDVDFEFVKEMDVTDAELFRTLHDTSIDVVNKEHKVEHYSYKFLNPETGQIKLATITNGIIKVLGKDTEKLLRTQDCAPINSEQLLVSKAIQDPMIDLILIEGLAGSGKNVVAISNAIKLLKTSKDKYNGIIYIRTPQNDEEPGEEIGFLATNEAKYGMYLGPMEDTIDFIVRQKIKPKSGDRRGDLEDRVEEEIERMMDECGIEATISTGLRGKTFHNKIVILDEWQNSAQATAQKVLTRIGKDCKTIVIGSQRQIDSKYVTKYNNGLAVLMGEARDRNITTNINMFAIELSKVVRSDMALFAEDLYTSTKGR
jgi:predicted ribonuclease YlaK